MPTRRWRVSSESPSSKHLDGTSGSASRLQAAPRLIPSLVCCFRSLLRKTAPAMRTGCQEAERRVWGGFWVNYSHATHVAASPREAEGSFPCRSGYPEQPRANHYHLDAPSTFSAAPGPDGFHMAPRHLRHNLCKAQNTQIHTFINLMNTQHKNSLKISIAQHLHLYIQAYIYTDRYRWM